MWGSFRLVFRKDLALSSFTGFSFAEVMYREVCGAARGLLHGSSTAILLEFLYWDLLCRGREISHVRKEYRDTLKIFETLVALFGVSCRICL